jgi:hypothetical protein
MTLMERPIPSHLIGLTDVAPSKTQKENVMAQSAEEIKEEIYQVFCTLPEGKYLWGTHAYGACYWNLMTVKANTGDKNDLLTVGAEPRAGVTVKAKAGAKGAGWRHVASNSDGCEFWVSDEGRYFAFKVADDAKFTKKLWKEGARNLAKLTAMGLIKVVRGH